MTFKTNFRSEVMPDGKVVVYDVPIFGDCEKAGIHFDDAWMDQAVKYHQQGEANGIAWAMHIHHTGEDGRPVLPAGAWTNTRKGWIRTKNGERVVGVICDLVFTDETAAKRAKLGQLLWRSPEIPMSAATGQTSPRFKSLALLDRDAPHNDDLPILTFKGASVHFRKKAVGLVSGASVGRDPVLAFADTGDSFFALMEPTAMATKTGKLKFEEEDKDPPASESESSESSESKPEGESKGGGWKAKIEALKGIKLEAEEIPEFLAALKECADAIGGETTPEAEEEPPELDPNVDEAADPIGEMPMKESSDLVKLRDEVVRLKATQIAEVKLREMRDLERDVEDATREAFAKLSAKGVSREEIIAFAADEPIARRARAIKKYAEVMDAKLLSRTADFEDHIDFAAGHTQSVPDEVMKFQADGPEVYEAALGQYRMWQQQPEDRKARIPLARWLEINRPGGNPNFANFGG